MFAWDEFAWDEQTGLDSQGEFLPGSFPYAVF